MEIPFEGLEYVDIPEKAQNIDPDINKTEILVLAEEDDMEGCEPLLEKIMGAINFNRDHYTIIKIKKGESHNLADLHRSMQFRTALVFYVPLGKLGLNIKAYRNKSLKTEDFSIIITNSISDISHNKDLKRALWECLKRNFDT